MGEYCGSKDTADGKPCRNLAGSCPIEHKGDNGNRGNGAKKGCNGGGPNAAPLYGGPSLPAGVEVGAQGLAGNPADFIDLASDAASAFGLPLAYVVQDYWIASCLHNMFRSGSPENMRAYREIDGEREVSAECLFTGGTALVSAWGITERYSDDLDIIAGSLSADISAEAGKKARSEFSKWVTLPFGWADKDVETHDSRHTGHRRMLLPIGGKQGYLKVEIASEHVGGGFYEDREITSLMGRCAPDPALGQYPELGGFDLPCTVPSFAAANKLDALHRRAAGGDLKGLRDRVRDLYDLASIAASQHADSARADIPALAQGASRSFGRGDAGAAPRPVSGYAASLIFKGGSEAQEALRGAYPQLEAIVWGALPEFDEALELAAGLDDPG